MSKNRVPDDARPLIKQAADRAFEEIRGVVGNSWEVSCLLHRLALESWRDGYTLGQQHGRDGVGQ